MRRVTTAIATLATASLLSGCASSHRVSHATAEPVDTRTLTDGEVYAVRAPGRLWVGDALGMRVLARHDAGVALALELGHDGRNTFRVPALADTPAYATVDESDEK